MSLRTVFKPTMASAAFVIFSASLFAVGCWIGGFVPKEIHNQNGKIETKETITEKDKLIAGLLLSLVLPGAAYLNYFINQKIEDESNKKISENEIKCKNRVNDYVVNCLKSLDKVQGVLAGLNEDQASQCLTEISKFKIGIQEYVEKYDTAQVIVKWFDDDKLRKKLIVKIVEETLKKYNISNKQIDKDFSTDVGKCLNWLRDSIDILGSRPVDINYMTQALQQHAVQKAVYRYALTNILYEHFKGQKEFDDMCKVKQVSSSYALRILQEYTDKLLQMIKIDT
jgi:hypothetical protein